MNRKIPNHDKPSPSKSNKKKVHSILKKTEDEPLFTDKNSESSDHHEKVPHAQLKISIDWFFLPKKIPMHQSKIRRKFSFLTIHISTF